VVGIAGVLAALGTLYASYDWAVAKAWPFAPVLQREFSPHIMGFDKWGRQHDESYALVTELASLRCQVRRLAKVVEREEQLELKNALERKKGDMQKLTGPDAEERREALSWEIGDYEERLRDATERFDATVTALKKCVANEAVARFPGAASTPMQLANQ
jgi:hypothetical protein